MPMALTLADLGTPEGACEQAELQATPPGSFPTESELQESEDFVCLICGRIPTSPGTEPATEITQTWGRIC